MLTVYNDPAFLKHQAGPGHPESPERLGAIMQVYDSIPGLQVVRQCQPALQEDIELIHKREYIDHLKSLKGDHLFMLDPDTAFSPFSLEAALKAAGAVIEAIRFVFSAENNRAFCAVRPPGHHAESNRGMGFCIFNNIAIGVAYTIGRGLAEKVAIVDWDVHHGNGTQNAFYTTNKVLYISLHQYPFYPGTGASYETGEAEGKGFTLNLPMMAGSGDEEYRQAFDDKIIPAIDNFKPDLLMISAGFDAHKNDPLAGIELSTDFYTEMTEIIVEMAKQHCYGRIVSTLEGGYSLNVLADSVKAHLKVLGGD